MSDKPTVGLKVDLTGVDAAERRVQGIKKSFDDLARATANASGAASTAMREMAQSSQAAASATAARSERTQRAVAREAAAVRAAAIQASRNHRDAVNAARAAEIAQRSASASNLAGLRAEEAQIRINIARMREAAAAARAARAGGGGGGPVGPNDITLLNRFAGALNFMRGSLRETRRLFFDLRTAVGVFLGAMVIGPLVKMVDAMTALKARAGAFTEAASDVPYLMEAIYQTAQRSRTPLEAVATLYTRLAPLARQLGKSQLDLLRVTETVSKGFQIGGATPEESKSASQQLAQALASNRLGGDELRSLAENAPILLGQIAKSLNMNTGQFIKWAQSGKANAAVIVGALEDSQSEIDRLFAKFPVTIGQSMTLVGNSLQYMIGRVNEATGASASVAAFISSFSRFLDAERTISMATAAIKGLGDAIKYMVDAAQWIGTFLPTLLAIGGAAVGVLALNRALLLLRSSFVVMGVLAGQVSLATAAVGGLGVAARGAGAAFGRMWAMIGGPYGALLIAAIALWNQLKNAQDAVAKSTAAASDAHVSAATALERASAFMQTYSDQTNRQAGANDTAAEAAKRKKAADEEAMRAAELRFKAERLLTIQLLEQARAAALSSAKQSLAAANGPFTGPKGLFAKVGELAAGDTAAQLGQDPVKAAADARRKNQQSYNELVANANLSTTDAKDLQGEIDRVRNQKFALTIPNLRGTPTATPTNPGGKPARNPFEGAEDGIAKLQAKLTGLQAQFKTMRADDPFSTWAAEIKEAGDQAAAALENGSKQNHVLAEQARSLAEQVKQWELLSAVQKESINNRRDAENAALDEQARSAAELRSQEIMHDYLGQAVIDQQGYAAAVKASNDVITQQEVVQARLAVLRRYGAADENDIFRKVLAAETAKGLAKKDAIAAAERATQAAMGEIDAQQRQILVTRAGSDALNERAVALAGIEKEYDKIFRQMDLMENRTRSLADTMVSAFGGVGQALGGVLESMNAYSRKAVEVQELQKRKDADPTADNTQALIDGQEDLRRQQLKTYGDMIGAAKSFFKEGTGGYKAMQKAEQAYRIYEFAMSAKSIITKTVETAAKLGLFGAQAQAAAAGGAANMFATLGPLGFAAVAAMVGVLAGFGIKALGGGGSAPIVTAESRQKTQGSGSVLGDAEAKSESISRAMDIVARNTNKDLEYSSEMVKSLRSIDSHISDVTTLLAKSLNLPGGAFDTGKLGLGSASSSGGLKGAASGFLLGLGGLPGLVLGLIGGLMKTTITRTLNDQGLQFGNQTVGNIVSGGVQGQSYQEVLETKKKSFLGIGLSTKTSTVTQTGALDADLARQIQLLVSSLRDGVLAAATELGVKGAETTIDSFNVELGKLSLKDMSGAEIQEALSAVFSKLGDDMAVAAIPFIEVLQKAGEGAFETLIRVTRDYEVLNTSLLSIGKTFGAVGVDSLAAREDLISMMGGIDALVQQTAFFADNFLTEAERMAPIQEAVVARMAELGQSGITTKEQFKQLVLGLDLSTEAGAEMYAALLAVAPGFAKMVDYLDQIAPAANANAHALENWQDAMGRVNDLRQQAIQAYNAEASELQQTIDKFQGFADSLRAFREQLDTSALGGGTAAQQYAAAGGAFRSTAATSLTGGAAGERALGQLQSVSERYLQVSMDTAKTAVDYARDVASVKIAVRAAENYALTQVSLAQQQLDELKAIAEANGLLNSNVLTMRDAINALTLAIAAANKLGIIKDPQWGAIQNVSVNKALAERTGYQGNFGSNGFQTWIVNQPEEVKALARGILMDAGQSSRIAFARGGAFTNGIVQSPTAFNIGQMGEAGSEGILPLAMGDHGLGVHAILPNNDNNGVLAVLREIQQDQRAIGSFSGINLGKMAKLLERFDENGMPVRATDPAEPIEVRVVA